MVDKFHKTGRAYHRILYGNTIAKNEYFVKREPENNKILVVPSKIRRWILYTKYNVHFL